MKGSEKERERQKDRTFARVLGCLRVSLCACAKSEGRRKRIKDIFTKASSM